MKDINLQIQDLMNHAHFHQTVENINKEKCIQRKNSPIINRGTIIEITADFSSETMEVKK